MSTRLSRVLAVLLLSVTLTACSGDEDAAREAAEQLAEGLASYDVSKVPATDKAAATELDEVLKALDRFDSTVEVDDVTVEDDTATATLQWSTQVGEKSWTRTTRAELVKGQDEWRYRPEPALVAEGLQEGDTLRVSTLKAERGRILGQDDAPLVRPRPVLRVGIDKTKVPAGRAVASARALAKVLDIDAKRFADQVKAAGPKAFVEGLVLRRADLPNDYGLRYADIPGAVGLSDHLPLAPTRAFAAQILGTVGPATAELVEKSDGRLSAGDETGRSGLQLRYDEQLAGTKGFRISAVRGEDETEELFSVDPVPGKDLQTTLDPRLQQDADDLLADTGSVSALVAIRPSTGEILAAASGPAGNGYNTATFGQYAPGSTFKMVSALALLRAGLAPGDTVECAPAVTVNGKRFENYDDYPSSGLGRIRFADAFANSCNTAFISSRDELGERGLGQAAAALGLGVDHDLGFPAYFGQVPPPEGETEKAADMIGQGKVLASPMAMAAVLASVMHGSTVVPLLLPDHTAEADPDQPLTRQEAGQLRDLLRAVVERGSGTALQSLGPDTLAKTGTAEFGTEQPPQTHAWLVGGTDDLAVAVFVEVGESGSGTAGPILKSFLERAGR